MGRPDLGDIDVSAEGALPKRGQLLFQGRCASLGFGE
jgi:hypothetical protein